MNAELFEFIIVLCIVLDLMPKDSS
jgi:hypothetical protein